MGWLALRVIPSPSVASGDEILIKSSIDSSFETCIAPQPAVPRQNQRSVVSANTCRLIWLWIEFNLLPMPSLFHKNPQKKWFVCGILNLCLLLCSTWAHAEAVKGLYVGSDFYAPNGTTQNAARTAGFNRLFLSFFHVDEHGDVTYNNTPVVRNGSYVGDPSWRSKLAALQREPTSINRIELTIGDVSKIVGGPQDKSFANIKSLIATQGTGPASILYKDLQALKNATGVKVIQLADDQTYDEASVVALGKIASAVGMKVTFCAYANPGFWADVKSRLGTNVDAVYLVCFGNGSDNDPAAWTQRFGSSIVYPGLWGNPDTPTTAMLKMRKWRQGLGITGGFMWLNGFMPNDAEKWAGALSYGLDSITPLRIVNKNSGKSLNLVNGGLTNGSAISQSDYDAGNDQRWMLVPTYTGNHFKIVSWVSGKCASIATDSSIAGGQLWTWDYNDDPSQQFNLIDAGNGWFKIKNVRSGLVLEVAGASTTADAPVQQNIDTGAASQLWKICPYKPGLLAYEHFDYPAGTLGGQNGGDGWNGDWSDVLITGTKVLAGSLLGSTNVPSGYDAQSSGNSAFIPNDRRVARYLDCSVSGNFGLYGYLNSNGRIGADGKTIYISFLEKPSKTSLFYEFELNRGMTRISGVGNDTHTDNVNLRGPDNSFTSIGTGNTNVNFYVMRIDFKAGGDDVRVYRNPATDTEPDQPTLTMDDFADMSFNRISLAAFANGNTAKFDEIRIASSWQYAIATAPEFTTISSSNIVAGDIFRQVHISAQVLCGSMNTYYLLDGNTGLRVLLNRPAQFEPGDKLEVTGLVERQQRFVELIEAQARKSGHSPLPAARPLDVLNSQNIPIWASAEGILTGFKDKGRQPMMELQVGSKTLEAKFQPSLKTSLNWQIGSRLKFTGVYLRENDPQADLINGIAGEFLLNSPAAVEVIARAPWWTLKRAMIAIGVLAVGLALAFIWIRSLRDQVNRQTVRLKSEIEQREQAERAHAIEEERSRISRDLHDDLGSILTQINLLANFTSGMKLSPELMRDRIRQISEKSHRMITALDEVVWMMNSKNESVSSLAAYLAAYVEEFLSKTDIVCRIEVPNSYAEKAVTAEVRNNLFPAVKEAVNNAVRHGKPHKIVLKLFVLENTLEIQIQDDGIGFDALHIVHGNGLINLQLRMQKVGGSCRIQSTPRNGTTVSLHVPLVQ